MIKIWKACVVLNSDGELLGNETFSSRSVLQREVMRELAYVAKYTVSPLLCSDQFQRGIFSFYGCCT